MGCISTKQHQSHGFGYSLEGTNETNNNQNQQRDRSPDLIQRHYLRSQQYMIIPKDPQFKFQPKSEQMLRLGDIAYSSIMIRRKSSRHADSPQQDQ